MIKIILTILAGISLVIAVFTITIVGFGIDNPATRAFNQTIPILPAAMVNGRFIPLADVDERLAMYERAVSYQSKSVPIDREQTRQEILDALIEQKIIKDLLNQHKDQPGPRIEEYSRFVLDKFDSDPKEALGISEKDFEKNIIVPDYHRKTLQVLLLTQAKDSQEYAKARQIKIAIDDGLDFAEAASMHSEDEDSKYIGGDLGFFTEERINPWFKRTVFRLSASSTSDVVVSPDGYHFLRVANRDPGPPERWQIQHILIRGLDTAQYLENQTKNYRIYLFLRD